MSCRFKRQIKIFEKLLHRSQAQHNPFQQPPACEDEDKPTFFFGAFARARLVDPIEGDSHFDDLSASIEQFSAKQAKKSDTVDGLAPPVRHNSSTTTILHIEKRHPAPNESRFNRIEIVTQGDSTPAMPSRTTPDRSALQSVNRTAQGTSQRRARVVKAAVQKRPVSSRPTYAGLKILPSDAYKKLLVPVEGTGTCSTQF